MQVDGRITSGSGVISLSMLGARGGGVVYPGAFYLMRFFCLQVDGSITSG